MILSDRLKAVTDLLPAGNVVADIGCDHGYISIKLVESGKYQKAIAMDVRKGPLSIAIENIEKAGLVDKITTRLSDGFAGIDKDEADGAIIAGMGGQLVIGILERSLDKVKTLKKLVLQPQSDIHLVRRYLRNNGFVILDEDMVKDDEKYYPMFLVSYTGEMQKLEDEMLQEVYDYYGHKLIDKKNNILYEYLIHEKNVYEVVLNKLPESNVERREEIKHIIELNRMCQELCS